MATRFLMVTDDYLAELEGAARQLAELVAQLRGNAVEIPLLSRHMGAPDQVVHREDPAPRPSSPSRYRIGRNTDVSYADVVWKHCEEREFDTATAWDAIKDLVETDAKRPKESLRFSLDKDSRFKRIEGRERVWWRRIDPSQTELVSDQN